LHTPALQIGTHFLLTLETVGIMVVMVKCSSTLCVVRRIVHLCRRLSDRKLVIIKQIPMEQMTADERQAALNEVMVLAMLDHPNIIRYYENFLEDTALMIVMEYAEGE